MTAPETPAPPTPSQTASDADRRSRHGLALAYSLLAQLSLIAALAIPAYEPRQVAGFYYHPKLLAAIHLITLGWISASIIGWFYVLAPTALAARLPVGRGDRWAFGLYATGIAGMVAHFWIAETSGMIWSGGLILLAFGWVAGRGGRAIRRSRLEPAARLHFTLAFANLIAAATLGMLVGLDKIVPFLPGFVLDKVFAHAHLAALGWATLMVMATGNRLLPMLIPARPPAGAGLWVGVIVFEVGTLGLAASLFVGSSWALAFAGLVTVGLAQFLLRVGRMFRRRLPAAPGLRRPDLAIGHLAAALLALALATVAGLALLAFPSAPWHPAAIWVYGILGLIGFLSQIIVGVSGRLVPISAWSRHLGGRILTGPSSPHQLVDRPAQVLVLGLWLAGVPLLTVGMAADRVGVVQVAAWCLLVAAVIDLLHKQQILAAARRAGEAREPAAAASPAPAPGRDPQTG